MAQHIFSDVVPPSAAPEHVGDHWVNTVSGIHYLSKGTTSVTDWVAVATATAATGNTGSGSPEGIVSAAPGSTYLDTSTNGFWVKATGVGNTGWVQLIS